MTLNENIKLLRMARNLSQMDLAKALEVMALKGDQKMIGHLEESTNIVKSNKKLICAIIANAFLLILFMLLNGLIAKASEILGHIFRRWQ